MFSCGFLYMHIMTSKRISIYAHIFLYNFRIPTLDFANLTGNFNVIKSCFFQSDHCNFRTVMTITFCARTREHHCLTGISTRCFKASRETLPESVTKISAHYGSPFLYCECHYLTEILSYESNAADVLAL